MRWSRQLIPTLKETPQEAEIPSHQLLLRAGLVRKLSTGLYTFLPLGFRVLRKVEQIIREEMDRAGALEVLMPALQPRELWERSGRYEVMKPVVYEMEDRQGRAVMLGPTHEEVITDLAAREISSYRQLPKNFYQIQTKFRDEIRSRFGLMRAKEFIMKDAYSFDESWDRAEESYQAMYRAYERIFHRCGLRTLAVEADTGAMGGRDSHEFMVPAEAGEDGLVVCEESGYAANLEKAVGLSPDSGVFEEDVPPIEEVATPGKSTIEEVSNFLRVEPRRLIKTLIYRVDGEPVAVLVPGDRELNELKLVHAANGAEVELADDDLIQTVTGAPTGFAGPVGLEIPILADEKLREYAGGVTGANKADTHLRNVVMSRDVTVRTFADLSFAREGDRCPRSGGPLRELRGIEVGHVFKLGTKYSEAMGALYLDEQGEQQPAIMGCYGIGVTRTLQAVIEQSHDADGIIWPISVAPYEVEVLPIAVQHAESVQCAEALARELEEAGVEVLLDDRDERPGVKFKDADLVGLPLRVGVGEKSLKRGVVEIKDRATGEMEEAPPATAGARILERVQSLRAAAMPG